MSVKPCAWVVVVLATVLTPSRSRAVDLPKWRDEPVLSKLACSGKLTPRPFAAWQEGVFDAQLEGELLRRADARAPDDASLKREAERLADARHYHGAARGICPNGSGWVLAMPSAEPPQVTHDVATGKVLALHLPPSTSACQSVVVAYAAAAGGFPEELSSRNATIDTRNLGDGVVSVSCYPRTPSWQGPLLWYLLPTGRGPTLNVAGDETLATKTAKDPVLALGKWINERRADQGLAPLTFQPALNNQAAQLAESGLLVHDRRKLNLAKKALARSRLQLLGEDRAAGDTLSDVAWLWWNSPRHRGLYLAKEAQAAGLSLQHDQGQIFAVLVTAKVTK